MTDAVESTTDVPLVYAGLVDGRLAVREANTLGLPVQRERALVDLAATGCAQNAPYKGFAGIFGVETSNKQEKDPSSLKRLRGR